jgi:hypothetical protein
MTISQSVLFVHQFYLQNGIPALDNILVEVNSDEQLPNFSRGTVFAHVYAALFWQEFTFQNLGAAYTRNLKT